MPETYGRDEPEPTRTEQAQLVFNEAVAGQSVVRRTILYAVIASALVIGLWFPPQLIVGIIALTLLMATDSGLE